MSGAHQAVYMNQRSFVLTVPDAPTIGTATATGLTTVNVSFTAPLYNGGSTITSYTATSSPGGITGTLNQAGSGTITVSGLTSGTAYTFTVRATNAIGQSAASAASNTVNLPFEVQYLVIGGGGGGGIEYGAGGGGAGGYRTATGFAASVGSNYEVWVGAGGPTRTNGGASRFHNITSAGGGKGSDGVSPPNSGGSGGGGRQDGPNPRPGGSGNSPFVSPSQGNNGGTGWAETEAGGGGGGGGAGVAGSNAPRNTGAAGGAGLASTITGPSVTRGGGGGGCGERGPCAPGGAGGGGAGGTGAGAANTGGGGGGGKRDGDPGPGPAGGPGGSGVVILRYPNTRTIAGTGLTFSTGTSGAFRITTITAGSGFVSWS